MSGLSIQLNRFGAGASSLETSQIYPPHQKSANEALKVIFDRHVGNAPSKKFPLRIQFKPGNPTLRAADQEIPLPKSRELKRINRIIQYYQHTGHLPRASLAKSEEMARDREAKKSVQSLGEASLPGANGNILAGMRLADDTLSLTRNVMYALPAFGPNDPVANHLGYYAGIFWTFFAFRELDDGIREHTRSREIGDGEGVRRAQSRLFSGGIVATGSLAYLAAKVTDTFALPSISSALSSTSNFLFGAGSILAMGTSILGAIRCDRFNRRLDEYLQNPALSEKERMRGAIQFLKDSISITSEEKEAIARQIEKEHPDWSIDLKEQLLSQKLANLTEVKVRYLKRRTSNKSLKMIVEQSNDILKKLNDPNLTLEGIRDASLLINTVQKENKIKMSLYILGFIAAALSFLAMVIGAITTAGVLPFVLYGIAGTIYLAITIYSISGALINNDSGNRVDMAPAARAPNVQLISN